MEERDEVLIGRVAGGDVSSLRTLYERYRGRLMTYAYYALGNRAQAEDVLQETFIRAFRHARDFDPGRRFSSWIYTIAANLCRDEMRRTMRRRAWGLRDLPETAVAEAPAAGPSPRAGAAGREFRERLLSELAALPPEQREVIALRFLESMSYAEIAEAVGCPLGTVQSRLHAAVKALRARLGEYR